MSTIEADRTWAEADRGLADWAAAVDAADGPGTQHAIPHPPGVPWACRHCGEAAPFPDWALLRELGWVGLASPARGVYPRHFCGWACLLAYAQGQADGTAPV